MSGYTPHLLLLGMVILLFIWERFSPKAVDKLEDNLLVLLMVLLTVVSFGQVIARYGFNTGWSAALEFTMVTFSWLILVGMSYGIKTGIHIGVDIVLNAVPKPIAKALSLFGAFAAIMYGLILLDATWLSMLGIDARGGAIEYWTKMFKIGIGTEELRYPVFMQEMFDLRPRVQRWLVLIILPISLAMLSYRSLQAFIDIARGKRDMLISGHEAQDLVSANKDSLKD